MKNVKTAQEFPFIRQPAKILSGTHQGKTEIHLQEQFTPAKTADATGGTPARVGTKHHAEMALILLQQNAFILETDKLQGPCFVRNAGGFHVGRLSSHHSTPESICVVIEDFKCLTGRSLVMARLAAAKTKLSHKYGRLAAKCGSKGRRIVLTDKALRYRTAARSQWQKTFRLANQATVSSTGKPSAN